MRTKGPILAVCLILGATLAAANHAAAASPVNRDNIVVILDASGSMKKTMPGSGQTKMQVAKDSLLQVIQQVPAETNVGLLVFGDSGAADGWLYPLGPVEQDRFAAAVRRPKADGRTPLGEYLKRGADRLLEQRKAQLGYGTYRLLIVTDGEATDAPQLERYVPDVLARGLFVDVIGVAMQQDHTLATRVHRYRRGDDAAMLRQAVSASIAEIGATKDDTTVDDESFAMLSALPDGLPAAMLESLTRMNNAPIEGIAAPGSAPRQVARPPASPGGPAPQSRGLSPKNFLCVAFAGFVILIILVKMIQFIRKLQN